MNTFTRRYALVVSLVALSPVVVQAQPVKGAATTAMVDPDEGLATLKKLIDAPAPAGLSEKDRAEHMSLTAWVKSAYDRVIAARDGGSGMASGKGAELNVMSPRDVATGQSSGKRQHGIRAQDMVRLQADFETESRKFQTLSNASKARHDIAMNAIRNMK